MGRKEGQEACQVTAVKEASLKSLQCFFPHHIKCHTNCKPNNWRKFSRIRLPTGAVWYDRTPAGGRTSSRTSAWLTTCTTSQCARLSLRIIETAKASGTASAGPARDKGCIHWYQKLKRKELCLNENIKKLEKFQQNCDNFLQLNCIALRWRFNASLLCSLVAS